MRVLLVFCLLLISGPSFGGQGYSKPPIFDPNESIFQLYVGPSLRPTFKGFNRPVYSLKTELQYKSVVHLILEGGHNAIRIKEPIVAEGADYLNYKSQGSFGRVGLGFNSPYLFGAKFLSYKTFLLGGYGKFGESTDIVYRSSVYQDFTLPAEIETRKFWTFEVGGSLVFDILDDFYAEVGLVLYAVNTDIFPYERAFETQLIPGVGGEHPGATFIFSAGMRLFN